MKKILIVTTVPDTICDILSGQPAFLKKYYDVRVACSSNLRVNKIVEREGVIVHSVPMVRGINPVFDLYSIFRMIIVLIQFKPDVIHSYTPKAGLVSMLSSFICRVPHRVHTFTGLLFPTSVGFKKKLLILVDKLICACATEVLAESKGVLNDLMSHKITTKNINIVGNGNIAGVDTEFYSLQNKSYQVSSEHLLDKFPILKDKFIFVYVGRLNQDKGIHELVEAFNLLKSFKESIVLFLIGGLDYTNPISNDILDKIRNDDYILEIGHVDDIRPYLAISDVLVLPSYREGFPNVVLQACSMQLPVISTAVSGSKELIVDSYNGWLVQPKNVQELLDSMIYASSMSKSSLITIGVNGRSEIVAKYERKFFWNELLSFYESL
ncbi:glycosyltransferase family 4 protein [Shewanella xiamenensis]|uniref:glycosyltransferase family 4 protein n=1 Tax=Shewanella xiamenensis TaxID=332186 RepID=UPI00313D0B39